jgi:DNA polymerase-3 subunit epsilon
MSRDFIQAAHESAVVWANKLLARNPNSWTILDTETTGLKRNDEIVQVSVINGAGNILLNNVLIKPAFATICPEAMAVHHITPDILKDAPSFREVEPCILNTIHGKLLCIYNAAYDLRMLAQSGRQAQLPIEGVTCAMLEYAKWVGDWDQYHSSFRWQKLQDGDHSSLGDCFATLDLIRRMAE